MPTLRNSIIKEILSHLQYGEYCLEDFDCKFPDDSTNLASIIFRADPTYSFSIIEGYVGNSFIRAMTYSQGRDRKSLKTVELPGAYKNLETNTHNTIDDCILRIPEWVTHIRQDLVASKERYNTEFDELTRVFQKHIDAEIDEPDSYFSDEERNNLIDKLNSLQERVNELEKKFSITEDKSKNIKTAIEKSKKDIDIYSKGVWYKTAGNKIIASLKRALGTKEGREALLEITKKLLS